MLFTEYNIFTMYYLSLRRISIKRKDRRIRKHKKHVVAHAHLSLFWFWDEFEANYFAAKKQDLFLLFLRRNISPDILILSQSHLRRSKNLKFSFYYATFFTVDLLRWSFRLSEILLYGFISSLINVLNIFTHTRLAIYRSDVFVSVWVLI